MAEDQTLDLSGVSVVDVDIPLETPARDFAFLSVRIVAQHGNISLSSLDDLMLQVSGATDLTGGQVNLQFNASLTHMNTALSRLQYRGAKDWFGQDIITLTVDDNANMGAGDRLTHTRRIIVTVTPVNDRPDVSVPSQPVVLMEDRELRLLNVQVNPRTRV